MIYVDVTAACLLPLQSGIPRTTRALWHTLLAHDVEATPIFWQPFRRCYTELSPRSTALLGDPFAHPSGRRAPRDTTGPLLRASFLDLRFMAKSVPLSDLLQPGDTLLLTSIFPDNRLAYLQRLLKSPGRKIAIFHDAIPMSDPNVAAWERRRHLKTLRLLAGMDAVVTVSPAAHDELTSLWLKHFITPAPSCVIPWPVPFLIERPPFFIPTRAPARVLCVSRLKQTKNHEVLFQACETLWQEGLALDLELIGCADEACETRAIVRRIEDLRRKGRSIRWRGHITDAELHRAYEEATFTIFPSTAEGFGLPVVESLWHGRPVICSDRPPMSELAAEGGCLTVDVSRSEAIAAALRLLLTDPSRRAQLAREAYDRPFLTWDDYARDLLQLLETP